MSHLKTSPSVIRTAAFFITLGIFRLAAKSFTVPAGIYPHIGLFSSFIRPVATSFIVPSPPEHTT